MAKYDIRFNCTNCKRGFFNPVGTGKLKGLFGHRGDKWVCNYCNTYHLTDRHGHLLGSGNELSD